MMPKTGENVFVVISATCYQGKKNYLKFQPRLKGKSFFFFSKKEKDWNESGYGFSEN